MPAIITHEMFGEKMLELVDSTAFPTTDTHDAFLLGNQGPDPLFYAFRMSGARKVKYLGSVMHQRNCARSFDAMRGFSIYLKDEEREIAEAYLCGFICHFVLDSTTHPFIYHEVETIMGAGVEGLNDAASQIHGQVEADLDSMMLWRTRNLDLAHYRPYREILRASYRVLYVVDKLYRFAAASAYGQTLQPGVFGQAVRDMRLSVRALYSPLGIKRSLIGGAERLVRSHSLAQAMSHRPGIFEFCDYDNRMHET